MAYMVNRDAPYSGLANLMAMNGRFGDTELVHMSKPEIRGLASLGELTINPDTGLPEAFNLGSFLPIIANIGLAAATGGMSVPMQMAVMGGANLAMGLAQDKPFGEALFGAALSAAGAGITRGITGALSGAGGASGAVTDVAAGTGFPDASSGYFVHTATPEAAIAGAGGLSPTGFDMSSLDAGYLDIGGSDYTGVADAYEPLATMGGDASITTPSAGSKVFDWIKENPVTTIGGLGLAGLALSGGEDVDVIEEEEIEPLPQSTFSGHKPREPLTEEGYLDLALRGGAALDDDDIDEDGQLAYDFFTPGEGTDGSFYTRKNKGGLVGLPQTGQRSNVTNFMLAGNKGTTPAFNIFELGKNLGDMGTEQPNTGVMQLAYGGQPKSNVSQMLNPVSQQSNINIDNPTHSKNEPLPVVNNPHGAVSVLSTAAKIALGMNPVTAMLTAIPSYLVGQALFNQTAKEPQYTGPVHSKTHEIEAINNPPSNITGYGVGFSPGVDVDEFSNEDDQLGELGNISQAISQAQAQQQAQEIAAFGNAVADTVHSTISGRGSPGVTAEFGDTGPSGGDGPDAPSDVGDDGQGGAPWSTGGLIGLAHGGKLEYYDEAFDSLYKLGVKYPELESMLAGETEASLPLEKRLRRVNPKSNATGLFQFLPKTAKDLGTTTSKIKKMSAREQGDLYAKYLKKYKWKPGTPLGMMQAAPSMANKPDDHIVYKKGSKEYERNPNWVGPEGEITVESIKKYYDPNYNMEPQEESEGGLDIIEMLKSIVPLSEGGTIDQYFEGQVVGRGDGMSDQIMFEVEGRNPDKALLSKDEYVLPADMVSIIGNGSSNAGAEVLDEFVKSTRQQGFGTRQQQRKINPQKGLSALV